MQNILHKYKYMRQTSGICTPQKIYLSEQKYTTKETFQFNWFCNSILLLFKYFM